ncbi:hypothetical protein WN944_010234 [Citrus x changshan-huyou]|uniref:Uncharacterized protein n=1 Tax=Citrus x changshan-huyou TaxID=2935761 RepID=A0AAP0MR98_9ROSI
MANICVQCNVDKQGIISAYSFSLLQYLLRDEDISGGQSQSKLHQQLCLESSSTSATRIPSRAFLISSGNSISTKVEINCMGSLQPRMTCLRLDCKTRVSSGWKPLWFGCQAVSLAK